ncbi:hypothetical protein [Saccharomonospora iraqiensis]|uniref:hypothetical protein n=1 Tax=Saccharomonospora iraqiensis TaxID=52698 RepID=UPI00040AE36A|nr:hypothetical protein [Saccharomonospora iraqiensis]
MACKITHRVNAQEIRFANRDAAERYAEIMGGGAHNWLFTTVTTTEAPPVVTTAPSVVTTEPAPAPRTPSR